ncbi:MAG: hypothetical protein MJ252_10035 [archaeon]|nr:hypothetical protein [archaeon]
MGACCTADENKRRNQPQANPNANANKPIVVQNQNPPTDIQNMPETPYENVQVNQPQPESQQPQPVEVQPIKEEIEEQQLDDEEPNIPNVRGSAPKRQNEEEIPSDNPNENKENEENLINKENNEEEKEKEVERAIELIIYYKDQLIFHDYASEKVSFGQITEQLGFNDPNKEYSIITSEGNQIDFDPKKILGEEFPNADKVALQINYIGLPLPNDSKEEYVKRTQCLGLPTMDSDSFSLYVYNIGNNSIDSFNYDITQENMELSLFNNFSAICNGNNYLFISGGDKPSEDPLHPESLDIFYKIDLTQSNEKSLVCEKLPNLNVPKTFHSMIYVPPFYIFIVGGEGTNTVELYDMQNNTLQVDSELNEQRSETSLCLVNNTHLYAFYGFRLHHTFVNSIERCNLQKGKRSWEMVNFKCPEDILPSQSFYSTFLCDYNKVILLGESDSEDDPSQNFIMECKEDECSLMPYKGLEKNFNAIYREKFFLPISTDSAALIPLLTEQMRVIILKNEEGEDLKVFECSAKEEEEED